MFQQKKDVISPTLPVPPYFNIDNFSYQAKFFQRCQDLAIGPKVTISFAHYRLNPRSSSQKFGPNHELPEALTSISQWPGYAPSPIVSLPGLAAELSVAAFNVKLEDDRFGVGSFKPLGPPYALLRRLRELLHRRTSIAITDCDIFAGKFRVALSTITVAAATSGNHGRALAWICNKVGCRCVIFMPEHTSNDREKRIAAYGASVVRVPGNFDAAVSAVEVASKRAGWMLFTETGLASDSSVTRRLNQWVFRIGQEIASELASHPPSHVFVSAGSGALAAGIAIGLGTLDTRLVVVEPQSADGLYQSILAGDRAPASGNSHTINGRTSR